MQVWGGSGEVVSSSKGEGEQGPSVGFGNTAFLSHRCYLRAALGKISSSFWASIFPSVKGRGWSGHSTGYGYEVVFYVC